MTFLFFITVSAVLVLALIVYRQAFQAPGKSTVPAEKITNSSASNTEPTSVSTGASFNQVVQVGHEQHDHSRDAARPSPESIQAIRELKKPAEGEGQVTEHPDGSASIKLGNRYRSVPVATIGEDGKVHVDYHGEKYLQEQTTIEVKNP